MTRLSHQSACSGPRTNGSICGKEGCIKRKRTVEVNSRYREEEKAIHPKIGERIISFFIGKYTKVRYRMWMLRKEANESKLNLRDLSRICAEHVLPVTCPLALITQIQGSGESLLNQLLDGHPGLHAHPHELMIGYPEEHIWPRIDLSDTSARWFDILFEDEASAYNKKGYKEDEENQEAFPFIFIPSLQREIFLNYLDGVQFITLRDVFDAYMTSYFGAWLNNQNYYGSKKFIAAYSSRIEMAGENTESFFDVYPDGRLISLVRNPESWFASARKRWPGKYADGGQAVNAWNRSAQAILWNRERYGDRVCLIQFEDLVSKTEAVMRFLAEFLTVEFDDILLEPTFNTFKRKASSVFKMKDQGDLNSRLSEDDPLAEHEADRLEEVTSEIYSLVLRECIRFD